MKTTIIAVLFIISFPVFALDQYWYSVNLAKKSEKGVSFSVLSQMRLNVPAGSVDLLLQDIKAGFSFFKSIFNIAFASRLLLKADSAFYLSPYLDLSAAKKFEKLKGLKIANRIQVEPRFTKAASGSYTFLRNLSSVYSPVISGVKLGFYIEDEIFFKFPIPSAGILSMNRLYGGLSLAPLEQFGIALYYLRQCVNTSGVWKPVHIIGSTVSVKI
ncbi:MAG TPA: hypothetical protein DC049_09345 [Spirochaetia bacterium]|nr:hypothetical protein [Spirochaetia bacterium]